ncbi:MAG: hypothetical protein K0R93_1113 [Anaerosolibacter sp.]|jgi:uncharacterized membrane protein YkvA (DUF1232 family)|nr:hypothetical protein [Anaerosolibacter sp.]
MVNTMEDIEKNEIFVVIKRLPRYSKLIYHLYKAPFVTRKQKLLLSTAMGYLISPIELVPGFIPIAGQVDDLIIVLTILKKVLKSSESKLIQDLLLYQGLTIEMIDEDIRISMAFAKAMVMKAGRLMGRTVLWVGKGSLAVGKKVIGKRYLKSSKMQKNSNQRLHKKPKYSKNE